MAGGALSILRPPTMPLLPCSTSCRLHVLARRDSRAAEELDRSYWQHGAVGDNVIMVDVGDGTGGRLFAAWHWHKISGASGDCSSYGELPRFCSAIGTRHLQEITHSANQVRLLRPSQCALLKLASAGGKGRSQTESTSTEIAWTPLRRFCVHSAHPFAFPLKNGRSRIPGCAYRGRCRISRYELFPGSLQSRFRRQRHQPSRRYL